jgi:hypothetical protein
VLRLNLSNIYELSLREMERSERLAVLSIQNMLGAVLGLGALSTIAPNLRELSLASSSDLAAEPVELPSTLQELRLELPHVPSLALAGLGMRTLGIHAREGGDAEVSALLSGAHAGIENVSLRGTPVSDAIFGELARFQRLRYLDVVNTNVTAEALHRFTAERPSLRFHPRPRATTQSRA